MKSTHTSRRGRVTAVLAATAALALTLTACSGGGGGETSLSGDNDSGSTGSGDLTKLNISMVPVLDAEPYLYAQDKGYYKDAGLDVTFSTNDSGPAVVTGVVNGTYDAAAAASLPVMIAVAKGAPLRMVSTASIDDDVPGDGHSGLIVKADSGITGYKDLEGKTVATNALTSITTLSTQIRMKEEGADPESVKFTAVPFKSAVQAVTQGQVDAAVVVSPFQTEAELDGLRVVGDPIQEAMPTGGPGLLLFTSESSAKAKQKAFEAFDKATARAQAELKGNEALQRKLAESLVGLSEDVAAKVPLPGLGTIKIDLDALQKQADLAYQYGYLAKKLTAKDLVVDF